MKAYIITLLGRPERLANAEAIAARVRLSGIVPIILPATRRDDKEFSEISYAASRDLERPMTAGEIACSWSHYRVCELIVDSGEGAFVFEDDAYLLRDLATVELGGVAHILSGSAWDPEHQRDGFAITHTDLRRRVHHTTGLPYGTQGYYLTPLGATVLTRHLTPIRWASDVALDRLSKHGILQTQLAVDPWAVQSDSIESYVGQR